MSLKDKIQNDIKDAMKAKAELKLSVLRMLSASMHNKELEKRAKSGKDEKLTDEEVVSAIRSEVKKRRDAIEGFQKGGRLDSAEKEAAESKILEEYLPQELPDEEIERIVKGVLNSMGEVTVKEFGKIMGMVMKNVQGRANGDRVKAMVDKFLNNN